jgi:hypothetical protein
VSVRVKPDPDRATYLVKVIGQLDGNNLQRFSFRVDAKKLVCVDIEGTGQMRFLLSRMFLKPEVLPKWRLAAMRFSVLEESLCGPMISP